MIDDNTLYIHLFFRVIYCAVLFDADHPFIGSLAQIESETVVEWEAKA